MNSICKTFSIFGLILIALVTVSCNDIEEDLLEEPPFSQISDDQFWKNNGDAELGVAAIYDAMQNAYAEKKFYWGEFRADNYILAPGAGVNARTLITNNLQASSGNIVAWDDLYQMITRANLAIDRIPQINGFSKNLLGEAYALRAFAYFDAVRVWGERGVPLFTESITGLDQDLTRPRTDAETIMNEVVLPDMLEAERLIVDPGNKFRFSQGSLYAFQANVYMWLQDYEKAKEAFDKLIALNEYELVTDRESWQQLFLNDEEEGGKFQEGPELIFSLKYEIDAGDRGGIYGLFFTGIPSIYIAPSLENEWIEKFPIDSASWVERYPDPEDLPKTTFTEEQPDGSTQEKILFGDWRYFVSRQEGTEIGEARVAKWNKNNYLPSTDDTDIVIYRYAGILLMLAEAENQLGNQARAVELVNQVRTARQLPTVDASRFNSTEELENFILEERQLELLGEGKRWWDLRRTGKAVDIMNPINGQTEETLVFPIFQDHLNENPELEQTPVYE